MGLDDFLAGMKPEVDDGFEAFKGMYKAVISSLTAGANQRTEEPQYTLELQVAELLEGDRAVGRKLWLRYPKTEAGLSSLNNALFTAGLELDRASGVAGMEASFANVQGKTVYIRAWGWAPEKNRDGTEIPEGERRTFQQGAIVSEKRVKKLVERTESTPF